MEKEPPQTKICHLGRFLDSLRSLGMTYWGRCTFCHSDRSVSGVEESTTLDEEPTQAKICHLGRFLDSFHSLGMTWSVGGSVMSARVIFGTLHVAMNHRRYIAWYHSTAQVVFETWRAANSRPYRRSTSAPIVPTMRDVVLRLIEVYPLSRTF